MVLVLLIPPLQAKESLAVGSRCHLFKAASSSKYNPVLTKRLHLYLSALFLRCLLILIFNKLPFNPLCEVSWELQLLHLMPSGHITQICVDFSSGTAFVDNCTAEERARPLSSLSPLAHQFYFCQGDVCWLPSVLWNGRGTGDIPVCDCNSPFPSLTCCSNCLKSRSFFLYAFISERRHNFSPVRPAS